jgi:uncharacterized protein YecE (DUF72 family)
MSSVYVGCAGWALPRSKAGLFPGSGSHLERYSRQLPGVEINSTFYRPHLRRTYSRWASSVPPGFRFAVKMPREISHIRRLVGIEEVLRTFLGEVGALESNLGPLLIQLPPGARFIHDVAASFFDTLRTLSFAPAVCEPRHASWFTPEADALCASYHIGRVAADPAVVPLAGRPGGWKGIVYYRLHGSPRVYYSSYDGTNLARLASELTGHVSDSETWCVFDNTAGNAALENALELLRFLKDQR